MRKQNWIYLKLSFAALFLIVLGQNCNVQQPGANIDLTSVGVMHTGFEKTCLPCHENRRPGSVDAVPINVSVGINQSAARFVHNDQFGGSGDCVNCHAYNPKLVGISWTSSIFGHTNTDGSNVSSCTSCHSVPSATPTTIPSITFDHATITQDCAACHFKPGSTWADATGAHTHVANLDAGKCFQCHISKMPPANILKSNSVAGNKNWFTHNSTFAGVMGSAGQDCSRCHLANLSNLGTSWAGASFDHKTLEGKGVSSCTPCHTTGVDRPSGLVGSPARFDHAVAGTGDCISCHSPTTAGTANPWKDGQFLHNQSLTTCMNCHSINRPAATALLPSSPTPVTSTKSLAQFLHKDLYGGLGDCVNCHNTKPNLLGVTWSNTGYYDHFDKNGVKISTCVDCHKKPVATTTSNPAIGYNHASIGAQDCSSCHTSPGTNWKDASAAHAHSITADRGKCYQCHSAMMPSAGTLKTSFVNKNYFIHSTQYTGSIGTTGDCGDCHLAVPANLGVTWAGAYFDHKDQTGATVTSCTTCHTTGSDRPSGPVGSNQYNHTNGGMGDCASCHKTTTVGTTKPWGDGNVNHSPLPINCKTCHVQAPPAGTRYPTSATTISNVYFHSATYNGTADCALCHRAVASNAGTTWAGGLFNHTSTGTTLVTSCIACHQNSLPSTTTAYPSNLKNSFVHSAQYTGNDCKGCHSSKNTNTMLQSAWAGGKWSGGPFGTHKTTAGATVTTCLPCHSNRDHNKGEECYKCHINAGKNWNDK